MNILKVKYVEENFQTWHRSLNILKVKYIEEIFKPDGNVDLGVKEGDGAKGENAKHAKSCPIDVPCDSSDGEGNAGGDW